MSAPLQWVKLWTASLTDFDWLALPIEERGVFLELVRLGGVRDPRGTIKGSDAAIAAGIRVDPVLVTRAIDRLASKPHLSLKRLAGGVRIANWSRYQAPARFLSHEQRGDSPRGAWPDKTRPEGDKTRPVWVGPALEELREVEAYPFEEDRDALALMKYANEFPTVDPLARVRAWAAYKLDQPLKAGDNPRSQLRTSFVTAVKYSRDLKTPTVLLGPKRGIG